jgi:hypothetical protein
LQRRASRVEELVDRARCHSNADPGVAMTSRRIMRSSEVAVTSKWFIVASGDEYT